jgi:hypothetical protein
MIRAVGLVAKYHEPMTSSATLDGGTDAPVAVRR